MLCVLVDRELLTSSLCFEVSPTYGDLYWSSTWQLFLFSLDRPVIDLSWKISHGVLYTAARLFLFGLNYGVPCFCCIAPETSEHLFFPTLWLRVSLHGYSLLCSTLPLVALPSAVIMSSLALIWMSFVLFLMFLFIPSMFANIFFGFPIMISVSVMSMPAL